MVMEAGVWRARLQSLMSKVLGGLGFCAAFYYSYSEKSTLRHQLIMRLRLISNERSTENRGKREIGADPAHEQGGGGGDEPNGSVWSAVASADPGAWLP